MSELNGREKAALRYYIGDVSGNDEFWSDPKAYTVLNSLFFAGTATERSRAAEGKRQSRDTCGYGAADEAFRGAVFGFREVLVGDGAPHIPRGAVV